MGACIIYYCPWDSVMSPCNIILPSTARKIQCISVFFKKINTVEKSVRKFPDWLLSYLPKREQSEAFCTRTANIWGKRQNWSRNDSLRRRHLQRGIGSYWEQIGRRLDLCLARNGVMMIQDIPRLISTKIIAG